MKGMKECTTLCYIEKDGCYLLMHRIKKKEDENSGKYIGVGGHVEKGETPQQCVKREVMEETGLTLKNCRLRGLITFVFADKDELAFLYTSDRFEGEVKQGCDEGDLCWVKKEEILSMPLWEGDRIFLKLLKENAPYFSLKLTYNGDELQEYELDYE